MAHHTNMTRQSIDETPVRKTVLEPGNGQQSARSSYVLVADDESVVRDFLKRCLEEWGYAVKQAGSSAEALELMVTKPASAVLCDVRMPGKDGLWLAERLHAHWPQTAVIMCTGVDDVQTVQQSRTLGAVDYITKPIAPERLLQVLRQASITPTEGSTTEDATSPSATPQMLHEREYEAEYTLESPVRCSACGERITTVKAVRLVRAQVNFTSTLPRRGRVIACPHCLAVIPAELSNF